MVHSQRAEQADKGPWVKWGEGSDQGVALEAHQAEKVLVHPFVHLVIGVVQVAQAAHEAKAKSRSHVGIAGAAPRRIDERLNLALEEARKREAGWRRVTRVPARDSVKHRLKCLRIVTHPRPEQRISFGDDIIFLRDA
eukprot:7391567-Prymnesium_polylepis.9